MTTQANEATCIYCGLPCGPDVPRAVVFHLSCGSMANAAVQPAAMKAAGKRAMPDCIATLREVLEAARSGELDQWWPEGE